MARVELDIKLRNENFFFLEKLIINKCNMNAIPCIEISQFLDSASECPNPTCAETTDMYFLITFSYMAVTQGFDCLMFTKETLSSKYSLDAIRAMSNTQ